MILGLEPGGIDRHRGIHIWAPATAWGRTGESHQEIAAEWSTRGDRQRIIETIGNRPS